MFAEHRWHIFINAEVQQLISRAAMMRLEFCSTDTLILHVLDIVMNKAITVEVLEGRQ